MTVKEQTQEHINTVGKLLDICIEHVIGRRECHDHSKLESPEAEIFEIYTAKLKDSTYGTPEYHQTLSEMKPALNHHYTHNRHHPEYHKNGIKDMNLIDLLEMLCDWKAATLRHADGNIAKSLELNQKRFGYSDELKEILRNTVNIIQADKI